MALDSTPKNEKAPKVAAIALEPTSLDAVAEHAKGEAIVQWENDLEKLMELEVVPSIRVVLCGPPPPGVALTEMAQFLRMQYPQAAIYYLTTNRSGFIRKDFVKNGFSDAFLLPIDAPTFGAAFHESLAKASDGQLKAFRAVKLVDIQAGQEMDFDTYLHLPSNNKRIKLSLAGDPIDPTMADKLKKHKVGNLHIEADDMQKFYQWTAQQLKNLGKSETMSATEKRDRMQTAVRDLISDIFQDSTADASFERGKAVAKDCQEIVKAYIMTSTGNAADNSWYEKMLQLGQGDNTIYTMASNVATFSAMFSMALGVGNPEHLAMAGLLHDIGLSELPPEIQTKPEHLRTPDEQTAYEKHPKVSVHLIQTRKMVVPEIVLKIVAQHHERFDGKGYPEHLRGGKIKPEAQLLGIADELVYLMTPIEGKPVLTPFQAIQKIYDGIPSGEDGHRWDPELIRRLYDLFKPKT